MAQEVDLGIDGLSDYKEIGSGGFATVYSALEVDLDRRVAVKVFAAIDDAGRRRFDRERLSMGRTADHPNIVTPLRSGYTNPDNKPFLVMEYMAGGSLQDRIESGGPLPWGEAIRLILPIADALGFSHSSGIVHKDVKPANILESRTRIVKLSDFGIAAIREATATSQMAYSILYSPPETFDAPRDPSSGMAVDPRDERSDLYSLAASLFVLGMGRPPFEAATPTGLMHQIITASVPPSGHARLDEFFNTAMSKSPGGRHTTASEFAEHLRSIGHVQAPTMNRVMEAASGRSSVVPAVVASMIHPPIAPSENEALKLPAIIPTGLAAPTIDHRAGTHQPREAANLRLHERHRKDASSRPHRLFGPMRIGIAMILLIGALGCSYGVALYVNGSTWFVRGNPSGELAIYQGRPGGFLWLEPKQRSDTGLVVAELNQESKDRVILEPTFRSRGDAEAFIEALVKQERTDSTGSPAINQLPPSTNADLESKVQAALAAAGLPSGVRSAVAGGEVTLTGIVQSEEVKSRAEEVASTVEGITSVVNSLTVGPVSEVIDTTSIAFSYNSSRLNSGAGPALDEVAGYLSANPGNLEIQGHTDSQEEGDLGGSGALDLSQARADSVKAYLVTRGIDASRLSTIGYAGTQPKADNSTADGRATNRRVDFAVS